MSDPVVPIRDGIRPEFGNERELLDYCQQQIRDFAKDAGVPPTRIMIALATHAPDGRLHVKTNSWDTEGKFACVENCGLAAMLFTERAISR